MPRPLKVFAARLGFYDTVVAVPSQAAALKAWGTRQNLFADGVARAEEDEAAIEAARAHPGVPLKRGIGTGEPFSLTPSLPHLPDAAPETPDPEGTGARHAARPTSKAKTPPPPPPPDRSALDAAEERVAETERLWRELEAGFARRRAALDDEEKRARGEHETAMGRAEADRSRACQRYDEAVRRAQRR